MIFLKNKILKNKIDNRNLQSSTVVILINATKQFWYAVQNPNWR